jgi:stage V sporulation protein R
LVIWKKFIEQQKAYQNGHSGLAYEMVINTNPSICYIMEDNTQMMQLLVTAHAAIGHNHFFKNNYLFREWTKPEFIVDYLVYARNYVKFCEEKYGNTHVETILDAAHALQYHSVFKYPRKDKSKEELRQQKTERIKDIYDSYNPLLDMEGFGDYKYSKILHYEEKETNEENVLFYLIKNSKVLRGWEKELLKIVMDVAQYFYPQIQTKMMNEGFASFTHHKIMNELYDYGYIDSGYMLEFIDSHCGVLHQSEFGKPGGGTINPYNLGFNMFQEVKRICDNPTDEDREFSPTYAGSDWNKTINFIVKNYRDESFIREFLTPNLIRKLKLVNVVTDEHSPHYTINAVHKEYDVIREKLANQYTWHSMFPDVNIIKPKSEFAKNTLYLEIETNLDNHVNAYHIAGIKQYLSFLWGDQVRVNQKYKTNNFTIV